MIPLGNPRSESSEGQRTRFDDSLSSAIPVSGRFPLAGSPFKILPENKKVPWKPLARSEE